MSRKSVLLTAVSLCLAVGLLITVVGCALPQAGASEGWSAPEESSSVYGTWEDSQGLVEEQLIQRSETRGSGISSSRGSGESSFGGSGIDSAMSSGSEERHHRPTPHFRDTREGEPVAIYQFINTVIVDDDFARITLHAKTADELGDAGFTLKVKNKYVPITPTGKNNYCYITPIMGTWTVNGVAMDPLAEGKIYPGKDGIIYLYFDELSTTDELVEVRGTFELYLISDWWNPVGVYEFYQS